MKEFNLASYQDWFNKNYSWAEMTIEEQEALPEMQDDFRLDGGWFPEDGEYGMYVQGFEISQQVYEEGIDTMNDKIREMLDKQFSGLFKDSDLISVTKSRFENKCELLPFKEKYIPVFECIAEFFTKTKPKVSLREYLEED